MKHKFPHAQRVLSIAFKRSQFGFAVLERPHELFSWGSRKMRPEDVSYTIGKVFRLISIYAPNVIVFEDMELSPFGRSSWVKVLSKSLEELGRELEIETKALAILDVKRRFGGERVSKHEIAEQLAIRFSQELGHDLPAKRTILTKEHYRMCIFDAVSLAAAFFIDR